MAVINKGPYYRLLSMVVTELGQGYCVVETDMDHKHLNPFGGIHGGVYSSIIDSACYWAAYGDLDEDAGLISLDVQVTYLGTARGGRLVCRAQLIKTGRTMCLTEAVLTDADGKLLAHGSSKQLVTRGLQTIDQAITATASSPLPPKFID